LSGRPCASWLSRAQPRPSSKPHLKLAHPVPYLGPPNPRGHERHSSRLPAASPPTGRGGALPAAEGQVARRGAIASPGYSAS
jgi:hypothetical protein